MEYFIKFMTFVGAVLGAGKLAYDIFMMKRGNLRSEYRFAKEFFSDLTLHESLHPFVKEKGYQALIGNSSLKSEEVAYLVSLSDVKGVVKDFIAGRKYLEFDRKENSVVFKEKYLSKWSRIWRKSFYILVYGAMATMACSPIFFQRDFFDNITQMVWSSVFVFVFFGFYAVMAVRAGANISRAERLVEKHQTI